ncbi:hypothetical protein DES40_2597 [Litorimonas taeanensis]|uniref:Uncharacterized protein n=1 Tax=Litorimonas taeanensis TaxID=568099 RepID=A0A420WFL2_9PROT|nr:hypothetical protein [Litorimonas taeanensis]RKQ69788.1 hypothetical protein DES40_2597 [Litorimonas taeanensis]
MLKPVFLLSASILVLPLFLTHAKAQNLEPQNKPSLDQRIDGPKRGNLTSAFDEKHKTCLERIAENSDLAYEEAMIWRSEGGGRRAKHCEAMALFALGHADEAAHRLDQLAQASDGGSPEMRANFYLEASNFWLAAENSYKAYASAKAGLDIDETRTDLRIARARAYVMRERYEYAETDLTYALKFEPQNVAALRYRADARFRQNKFDAALKDIELALTLAPESVETALLRGRIKEARRGASN